MRLLKRRKYTRPDDRGQEVVLCPYNEVAPSLKLTQEQIETARAWHRNHRFPWWEIRFFLLGLAVAVVVLFLPHINLVSLAPVWDWVCAVIAIGTVIALSPILTGALLRHTSGGVLAAGRCPCCYYHLSLLPAEDDGCTVCPGCGAAWLLAQRRGRVEEEQQ